MVMATTGREVSTACSGRAKTPLPWNATPTPMTVSTSSPAPSNKNEGTRAPEARRAASATQVAQARKSIPRPQADESLATDTWRLEVEGGGSHGAAADGTELQTRQPQLAVVAAQERLALGLVEGQGGPGEADDEEDHSARGDECTACIDLRGLRGVLQLRAVGDGDGAEGEQANAHPRRPAAALAHHDFEAFRGEVEIAVLARVASDQERDVAGRHVAELALGGLGHPAGAVEDLAAGAHGDVEGLAAHGGADGELAAVRPARPTLGRSRQRRCRGRHLGLRLRTRRLRLGLGHWLGPAGQRPQQLAQRQLGVRVELIDGASARLGTGKKASFMGLM